jgi:ATP-dependent Clp protease ATP-binding subunit ClpX
VADSDESLLENLGAFRPEDSKLLENGLVEFQYDGDSVFDRAVTISDKALQVLVEPKVIARPEVLRRLAKAPESEEATPARTTRPRVITSPREIYDRLSKTVCFQEEAKRILAVQGHQHLLRAAATGADADALSGVRNHVLLVGATGTGKTLMADSLARILDVPFHAADATTMTAEGYIGTHLWEVFYQMYKRSGRDLARAETGILFIDEIDKTATHSGSDFYIATTAVQEALLTVLQGGSISFPESGSWREHNHVELKTDRIMFILGGSFRGLPEVIAKRSAAAGGRIGFFTKGDASRIGGLRNNDLIELGMIPELVGRIGAKVQLEPMTAEHLKHILLASDRSVLRRYEAFFAQQKRKFNWTADAIDAIASAASALEVGARGLETVMEQVLRDDLYELDGKRPVKLSGKIVRVRLGK